MSECVKSFFLGENIPLYWVPGFNFFLLPEIFLGDFQFGGAGGHYLNSLRLSNPSVSKEYPYLLEAKEISQLLRAVTALVEDPGSVPSTLLDTYAPLTLPGNPAPSLSFISKY